MSARLPSFFPGFNHDLYLEIVLIRLALHLSGSGIVPVAVSAALEKVRPAAGSGVRVRLPYPGRLVLLHRRGAWH